LAGRRHFTVNPAPTPVSIAEVSLEDFLIADPKKKKEKRRSPLAGSYATDGEQ